MTGEWLLPYTLHVMKLTPINSTMQMISLTSRHQHYVFAVSFFFDKI